MEQIERYPSYETCVVKALSASDQPLTVDALVEQVKRQRPIGKGARSAVYRAIRKLFQAVPVAPSRFGWLSHLLQGSTIRHPLTSEEARRGFILLDELEHAVFFPQFFQNHRPDARRLSIELLGGPTIKAEAAIERKIWSLRLGKAFAEWIDELGGQGRDDILISVLDATNGSYMLRLQPREIRDEEQIRDRNIQLALAAEELVVGSRRPGKTVPTWELAALLIGRGLFADPVPPDDLHGALHHFSMLKLRDNAAYTIGDQVPLGAWAQTDESRSVEDAVGEMLEPPAWNYHGDEWPEAPDERSLLESISEDDSCPDYESYLAQQQVADDPDEALSHGDFHLLEAELETLLGLEQEFGYLLPEQQIRVMELAERLYLDPDTLRSQDQDASDGLDEDESPFWDN